MYCMYEENVLQRKYMEDEREIAEIDKKYSQGKLQMYYKKSMSPRVKEHIKKLMGRGK